MSKDIMPVNDKGQRHGYWEWYSWNMELRFKCFYHNGKHVGYDEYSIGGELNKKRYHI